MSVKVADKLTQFNNGTYMLMDASAVEYQTQDGNSISVQEALDNGAGGAGDAGDGEIIDDENVATGKTYSSFKIEEELEGLETELYDYMNTALAGLNKLTKEIIDDVALVVNDNVLYLYKDPDDTGNIYMQMMLINGIAVELGSTEVNLDEYVTEIEFQEFKSSIDLSNYYNKTEIDEKLEDKRVYNSLEELNTKLIRLETKQINKTTIVDMIPTSVCYKITPKDSNSFSKILIVDLYGGCVLITGSMIPDYKSLKAVRLSNGCWESYSASNNVANKIESVYFDDSYIYVNCLNYIKINFEGGFTNIEKIDSLPSNTTQLPIVDLTQQTNLTVNDIPKTTITPAFPNGIVVASGGVVINYIVRNGWCSVNFAFNISSTTTFSWTDIATGLPKPANSVNITLMNEEGRMNRPIIIKINSTGSVSSSVPAEHSTVDWWRGNISYPVAE